jgi:hypothetical protein
MDDVKVLRSIQTICESGDAQRLWTQQTIKALAKLSEGNLRAAMQTVRFHFGADCQPRLLARAIREERRRFLDYVQRVAVKPVTPTAKAKLERGARLFARAGGLQRGRKGFAAMTPEQFARVQPMGAAAWRRIAAERASARAQILSGDALPPPGAHVDLPPFWWTEGTAAVPAASNAEVVIGPPGAVAVPIPRNVAPVTIGLPRGMPRAGRREGPSK